MASNQKSPVIKMGSILIIIILYVFLQQFGILNLLAPGSLADGGTGYGMLFVIGLLTSVHCIAMCGGLNLSQVLPESGGRSSFAPALLYNLGRIISYTAIGFVLGAAGMLIDLGGSKAGLPLMVQGILKIIAGIFMVVMGLNLLGLFPFLRRLQPVLPGRLGERIDQGQVRSKRPFVIGLLNGFMPCGPLQAMQIVALSSGNPFAGAFAMLMYALGTVPLMLGLGTLVLALGKRFTHKVQYAGAILVVVLGLAMLTQGGSLSGWFSAPGAAAASDDSLVLTKDGRQLIESTLSLRRYPDITVCAGIPVKWVIEAPEGSVNGCNYAMLIREYGIQHEFHTGENIIEFTPAQAGVINYSCWMGMISGTITVAASSGDRVDE